MSKKNIEKYIPKAIKEIEKVFAKELKNNGIPNTYNGYISSFGASIIQSGLKPTLALFENENAKTQEKKQLLPSLILKILDPDTKESSLLRYVLQKNNEAYLKQQIINISIAIKLSLRTFKLDKGSKNE